jgi:HPt (histidine-containing phosphotransfer) domain-containing protein
VAAGDAGGLKRAAHVLQGSVGNFGAPAALDAARALEKTAQSGAMAGAPMALGRLEAIVGKVVSELSELIAVAV